MGEFDNSRYDALALAVQLYSHQSIVYLHQIIPAAESFLDWLNIDGVESFDD